MKMTENIQPICIIEDSSIAGTGRVDNIKSLASTLERGARLNLVREKDNYFDEWAIKIMDPEGRRLGYLTCEYNQIVSRIIDGGMDAFAEFCSMEDRQGWTDIKVKVMLDGNKHNGQ